MVDYCRPGHKCIFASKKKLSGKKTSLVGPVAMALIRYKLVTSSIGHERHVCAHKCVYVCTCVYNPVYACVGEYTHVGENCTRTALSTYGDSYPCVVITK